MNVRLPPKKEEEMAPETHPDAHRTSPHDPVVAAIGNSREIDLAATLERVVASAVSSAIAAVKAEAAPAQWRSMTNDRRVVVQQCKRLNPSRLPQFVPRVSATDHDESTWTNTSKANFIYSRRKLIQYGFFPVGIATALIASIAFQLGMEDFLFPGGDATSAEATANQIPSPSPVSSVTSQDIAERFVYAENIQDRIDLLRDPRHAGLLREHFVSMKRQGLEQEVAELNPILRIRSGDLTFDRFHVRFDDGRNRLLAVVHERTGLYVDAAAYLRHGSATWDELIGGQAAEAEMRVLVSPSDYYNYAYSDSEVYQAYELTSPDWEGGPLHGYVKRNTRRARLMRQALAGREPLRMTLGLSRQASSPDAFLIRKVAAAGWVKDVGGLALEESPFAVHIPTALDKELQRRKRSLDLRDLPPATEPPRRLPVPMRHALPSLKF